MDALTKQALLHVDDPEQRVHQGHYHLVSTDGEVIPPQLWEAMAKPGCEIAIRMWPIPKAS